MRPAGLSLLLAASLALIAHAGTLKPVVRARGRLGAHVLIVVDVSGSITGAPFARALASVRLISEQPTDELHLAVIAFDHRFRRWSYKGKRWARLPDAQAVQHLERWLRARGAQGGTQVVPPLRAALADPQSELSVVLVTDGVFEERSALVLAALALGQVGRARKRRPPARVAVLSVAPITTAHVLARVGDLGGGGCWSYAPTKR